MNAIRIPAAALALLLAASGTAASPTRFWGLIPPDPARPLSRSEVGGVYDPARDRLVFYGGLRGRPLDETYSYDFATGLWTQIVAAPFPPRRTNHAAVYDPVRHRMVIFGGEIDDETTLNDAWAFDLATDTWSEIATFGAAPRSNMVSGYDSARDGLWVALGYGLADFDRTVAFLDFATNVWSIDAGTGSIPERRIGAMGAIDAARDRLVVFGGNDRRTYYDDTLTLDLSTLEWRRLPRGDSLPSRRGFGRMVADPARDRVVVFGGNREGDFFGDLWALTLDNERWSRLEVEGSAPSTRNTFLLVLDTLRDRLVLFAGQKRGERRNDLWEFVDRAGGTGSGTLRVSGWLAPATVSVSRGSRIDVDIQGRLAGGARYVLFADARGDGEPAILPGGIAFCFDPRPGSPGFARGTTIVCDAVGLDLSSGPLAGLSPPVLSGCPLAAALPSFARLVSGAAVNLPSGRSFTLQAIVRDPARAGGFGATPPVRVAVR